MLCFYHLEIPKNSGQAHYAAATAYRISWITVPFTGSSLVKMSPFPLSDAKPIEGLELSSDMMSHFGKVVLAIALRRVSEGNCGSRAIGEETLAII